MKTTAVACTLFAAAALAQPHGGHHKVHHNKRDVVTEVEWVTAVEYVTQLVDSTTTVWITPGQELADPTTVEAAKPTTTLTTTSTHHKVKKPKTTTSTSSVAPVVPTTTSVYTPPPAPTTSTTSTTSTTPTPTPEEPTSTYTPPAPEPTTTSQEVVAAQPTTIVTSVYTPPVESTTSVVAAAAATSSAAVDETNDSSSGSSGSSYSGDLTYYTIGLGACGTDNTGEDDSVSIVALSYLFMGTESNGNPLCGQTITIEANGKSTTATVRDKCMGCAIHDIDVSEKVYMDLWGSLSSGRTECTWYLNN